MSWSSAANLYRKATPVRKEAGSAKRGADSSVKYMTKARIRSLQRHRRAAAAKLDTSKGTAVGRQNRSRIAARLKAQRAGKTLKSPVMMTVGQAKRRLCK